MGRPRTELTPQTWTRIETLLRRGNTSRSISEKLAADGIEVSPSTISRRAKELLAKRRGDRSPPSSRKKTAAKRSSASSAEVAIASPSIPEVDEGMTVGALRDTLREVNQLMAAARADQNTPLEGTLLRVKLQALNLIGRHEPPPKADPNEQPDMIKIGSEVAERLHKMVEILAR